MKQALLQEKYPIFVAEIGKNETTYRSVDELVAYYQARIAENPKVQFIGVFDHYAHTRKIEGPIVEGMTAAVDIIFCFGFAIPTPADAGRAPALHRHRRHGRQVRHQLPRSPHAAGQPGHGSVDHRPAQRLTFNPRQGSP